MRSGEETPQPETTLPWFPLTLFSPATRYPGRQSLAQLRKSLPHPFLHGLDRDPQHPGDLRVLQALLAAQLEYLAAVVGEVVNGVSHYSLELDPKHLIFSGGRASHFDRGCCCFARNDPLVPNMIERPIAGGSNEIRPEGLFYLDRLASTPDLQHHFLPDLFRQRPLANDRLRHSDEVRVMRTEE